jgi:glycosyltransferase involved in cell wall biosynthesis
LLKSSAFAAAAVPFLERSPATRRLDASMRVGLNLVYLVRRAGGAGTYARELIPELLIAEPGLRITAFVSRELDPEDRRRPWASEVEWVELPVTVTHGPPWNSLRSMRAQWLSTPRRAVGRRLDVVHGLANVAPIVSPSVATVVTLLDLIWLRHPDTMTARETLGMKLSAIPSARMADRVIAISEAARSDMVRTLGLNPGRIDVTPLGVRLDGDAPIAGEARLRAALDLGERPVVLCVSQKRTHKNLRRLIEALAGLDAVLVLPGSPTPHERELRRVSEALGVADRVRFPQWLEGDQLEGLYRMAACFVLPSFEEGFGLPVLEAMARGTPVCCSNTSSLPEVAGDAALLFDPASVEAIREAVGRLLTDRRLAAELAGRGRARARSFTWRRTAEATLAVYRRAIAERRPFSYDRGRRRS